MKRPSLTLRLAALFAAVSAAVLLAVGGVIWRQIDEHFEQLDLMELHARMAAVRKAFDESGGNPVDVAAHLGHSLPGHASVEVSVEDTVSGALLYASPGAVFPDQLRAEPEGHSIVWEAAGERYRGIAAMTSGTKGSPARVLVSLNLAHHADFLVTFRHTLIGALMLGIVFSSLLGWWVANRGLRPVAEMAALARRISAESLHDRLELAALPAELAELGAAFNAMLARLEDSFRRLSDFSSDIAHELRTPISNLLVQTQVAVSQVRSANEYRETLYSSLEEYERLARMVADMLFIAQAENGLVVPQRKVVCLEDEVDQLIEFYSPLAEEASVSLCRVGEANCLGEASLLRRAVANLLVNAIRHTVAGGEIQVRLMCLDGESELAVENPGEAIPPQHLPRLFDRFYRADASRHRDSESTGLGLAIVKSIVEAHGGQVWVNTPPGFNVFGFRLPAA